MIGRFEWAEVRPYAAPDSARNKADGAYLTAPSVGSKHNNTVRTTRKEALIKPFPVAASLIADAVIAAKRIKTAAYSINLVCGSNAYSVLFIAVKKCQFTFSIVSMTSGSLGTSSNQP